MNEVNRIGQMPFLNPDACRTMKIPKHIRWRTYCAALVRLQIGGIA